MAASMKLYRVRLVAVIGGLVVAALAVAVLVFVVSSAPSRPATPSVDAQIAYDASARILAQSAQTAAETYATDHNGSYASMDANALNAIEPTIRSAASNTDAYLGNVSVSGGGTGYSVTTTSPSSNTFTITRAADGTSARTCTASANTGECVNGTW